MSGGELLLDYFSLYSERCGDLNMNTFGYRIAPEVFTAYPGYCRGVVVFSDVDNGGQNADLLALLRATERHVRASISGNVSEYPKIAAWRDAYRKFGAKPSEHRSSIEAMTRRVVKPDDLPSINPLVDVGNIVSLKYMLPAGVHPLAAGREALELRRATAGDVFVPAGSASPEQPSEGEIVFTSGNEVLTRRWTWRQAAGTQTLPDTQCVFFNIDGLAPTTRAEVIAAMQEVSHLVQKHCRGIILQSRILDSVDPSMSVAYR